MRNVISPTCELLGIPGAGKSTFIQNSASEPWKQSFVDLQEALFISLCRAQSDSPETVLSDSRYQANTRQEARQRYISRHFDRSVKRAQLADFIAQHEDYVRQVLLSLEQTTDPAERSSVLFWLRRLFSKFRHVLPSKTQVFPSHESAGDAAEHAMVLSWLHNLFARYQYVTPFTGKGQYLLLDEGFIGRVVTLFAYRPEAPAPGEIKTYIELAPRPAAAVRLNLTAEQSLSRLMKRPRGLPIRFKPLSEGQRMAVLENCMRCIDVAVAELSALGVPVIEVDATLEPNDQVRAVASALGMCERAEPARSLA